MIDDYTRLVDAADDHELYIIEQVATRAGVIWHCPNEDCHWINRSDEKTCGCPTPSACGCVQSEVPQEGHR